MSDTEFGTFDTPEEDGNPGSSNFSDAFNDMESTISDLPQGAFVTLRSGSSEPRYAPIYEGEGAVAIRILADRCGLTFGGSVNIYVDNALVNFDTPVASGTVVTFVGNVKGG